MNVTDHTDQRLVKVEKDNRRHERVLHLMKMKRLGSIRSIQTMPAPTDSGLFASSAYLDRSRSLESFAKQHEHDDQDDLIGRWKRRDRQRSCRIESGVCDSRWMQTTIIALVTVMALWLVKE